MAVLAMSRKLIAQKYLKPAISLKESAWESPIGRIEWYFAFVVLFAEIDTQQLLPRF